MTRPPISGPAPSDRPEIKGWCPGTLRPMASGDGLLVRVRPPQGRLTPEQAMELAALAHAHGNGMLQLTNRANIQIRGVTPDGLTALQAGLTAAGLLDPALRPEDEARLNILISPFYPPPGPPDPTDTLAIADRLHAALVAASDLTLPGKFGFAVDTGSGATELAGVSADIRIERAGDVLIVRADGVDTGRPVDSPADAATTAVALARWFVAAGGVDARGRGRMRELIAAGCAVPAALCGDRRPDPPSTRVQGYGPRFTGCVLGAAGGMVSSAQLTDLARHLARGQLRAGQGLAELRVTPWRSFALPCGPLTPGDGAEWPWITDAADPRLRVTACVGQPLCPQAHIATGWAQALSRRLPAGVTAHVSGCAKGCAHPGAAALTLVGTPRGIDLVRDGRAWDRPAATGLAPDALITRLEDDDDDPFL